MISANRDMSSDDEFQKYLCAWITYFSECQKFDRMLSGDGVPRTAQHFHLMKIHSRKVAARVFAEVPVKDRAKWNLATKEACKIVEYGKTRRGS